MPRYIYYTFYHKLIIAKSGYVHKNPGPRSANDTICVDRNRHGGGVAVFIFETLSACRCPQFEPDGLEFICISVKTNSNNFILICYYYNPPNSNMDTFLNGFQSVLAAASVDNFSGVFSIGDTKMLNIKTGVIKMKVV